MKRAFCIVFSLLLVIGCLHVASTAIAEEVQRERGFFMPTSITIVLANERVLAQEGIPEWMAEAAKIVMANYGLYDKYLETEGHIPPGDIILRAQDTGAIGWASGPTLGFNISWIAPGRGGHRDWGMVAHELVHLIQGYPGGQQGAGLPFWAMEGLTDAMRHTFFEPEVPMRSVNPANASYTNAYQITAGFFMYIMDEYDTEFLRTLNRMGRTRTYSVDIFEESTGKGLDELWAEYTEKILVPHHRDNRRMVPATLFPNLMQHVQEFKEHFATLEEEPRPGQEQPRGQGQGGQRQRQ